MRNPFYLKKGTNKVNQNLAINVYTIGALNLLENVMHFFLRSLLTISTKVNDVSKAKLLIEQFACYWKVISTCNTYTIAIKKKVFTRECVIPIALEEIFSWRVHTDSPFTSSTLSGIFFNLNLKELIEPEE